MLIKKIPVMFHQYELTKPGAKGAVEIQCRC